MDEETKVKILRPGSQTELGYRYSELPARFEKSAGPYVTVSEEFEKAYDEASAATVKARYQIDDNYARQVDALLKKRGGN